MKCLRRASDKCPSVLIDILNPFSLTEWNQFTFCHLLPTAHAKTSIEDKRIAFGTFRSKKVQKQERTDKYISFWKTHLSAKISADREPIHFPWGLLPTADSSHSLKFHSCGEWVQHTHKQLSCQSSHPLQTADPHNNWRHTYEGLSALESLACINASQNCRNPSPLQPGCRRLRACPFS